MDTVSAENQLIQSAIPCGMAHQGEVILWFLVAWIITPKSYRLKQQWLRLCWDVAVLSRLHLRLRHSARPFALSHFSRGWFPIREKTPLFWFRAYVGREKVVEFWRLTNIAKSDIPRVSVRLAWQEHSLPTIASSLLSLPLHFCILPLSGFWQESGLWVNHQ